MIRFLCITILMLICSLSSVSIALSQNGNPAIRTSGFHQPQRNEAPGLQNTNNRLRTAPVRSSQQIPLTNAQNSRTKSTNKTQATSKRITPIDRPVQSGQNQNSKMASRQAPSIWGTFGALLVVISIILVIAKLFKKHHPLASTNLPLEVMEVLGKRSLDARQTIHFVRCGSRILILGSSPAGLEMLSEVMDPVEVDLITGMCRERTQATRANNSFRNLFQATQKTSDSSKKNQKVHPTQAKEILDQEQSPRSPAMEDFADYDSAVNRLQQKLQQNSRQSFNDNVESGHA